VNTLNNIDKEYAGFFLEHTVAVQQCRKEHVENKDNLKKYHMNTTKFRTFFKKFFYPRCFVGIYTWIQGDSV